MAIWNKKDPLSLEDVSVYLSGDFFTGKEILEKKLGEVKVRIEKSDLTRADVIVQGFNQPISDVRARIKRQLWDGWDIVTMTEEQLCEVLLPYFDYAKWEYFKKQIDSAKSKGRNSIDITYDKLFNLAYSPIVLFSDDKDAPTLEGKEIFMLNPDDDDNITIDPIKIFLEQRMGAKVTASFNPRTTDYCLLRESTIGKLKKGEKDIFIQMIERGYNSSHDCEEFRPKFILESEVLALMKNFGEL